MEVDIAEDKVERSYLAGGKEILEGASRNEEFAAELCEIGTTVNSAVRRMGIASGHDSKKNLPLLIVDKFHSRLFVPEGWHGQDFKEREESKQQNHCRKAIFKLSAAKAVHEVSLDNPEDINSLASTLAKFDASEVGRKWKKPCLR